MYNICGRLYFPKMTTKISVIVPVFLQYDFGTPPSSVGIYFSIPWIWAGPVAALNNKIWQQWSCTISGIAFNWPSRFCFQLFRSHLPCSKCRFPEITLLWVAESTWRSPGWWDTVKGEEEISQGAPRHQVCTRNYLSSGTNLSFLLAQLMPHRSGTPCPAKPFLHSWSVAFWEKVKNWKRKISCICPASVNNLLSYYWAGAPAHNSYKLWTKDSYMKTLKFDTDRQILQTN